LAWLLSIFADGDRSEFADEITRYLVNHVNLEESTGAGHLYSYYEEMTRHTLLHSSTRTDAIVLEALVLGDPKAKVIPSLVKGLLEKRQDGHWENTQENAWSIIAMDRYFQGILTHNILLTL
jgi:hypothetical protein